MHMTCEHLTEYFKNECKKIIQAQWSNLQNSAMVECGGCPAFHKIGFWFLLKIL